MIHKKGGNEVSHLTLKKSIVYLSFIFLLLGRLLFSEKEAAYFHQASTEDKEVRLAVLYPSLGNLKAFVTLKEKGVFSLPDLVIVGVYYEKERTEYKQSLNWVEKNKIDWIKFHKITGELNKESLYTQNAFSQDFQEIYRKSDGIVFTGGADIPPYVYGEQTSLLTAIYTPYRHFYELSLVFHLLGGHQDEQSKPLLENDPEFPILGICLGAQTLNIGTGGTMIQDIWSENYGMQYLEEVIAMSRDNWHRNPAAHLHPELDLARYHFHPIRLIKSGKFIEEFGFSEADMPYTLSSHHQAVDNLGKGMKAIATSLDGKIVEAIEHKEFPAVLGIQFHPEFSSLWDPDAKFKFTPEDKKETSLYSILENTPSSLSFHKKIWSWFAQKIETHHQKRKN